MGKTEDRKPVDGEALAMMRERGGKWAAYENKAFDSASAGHVQFLKYGDGCTYPEPPIHMPDTAAGVGWKYLHIGYVDFESGCILSAETPMTRGNEDEPDHGGPFRPDWVSPPGETIADILEERKWSVEDFAGHMTMSLTEAQDLLRGKTSIDENLASKLSVVIGSTRTFWLVREGVYKQELERLGKTRPT